MTPALAVLHQLLLQIVLPLVAAILSIVGAFLAHRLISAFEDKTGIQIDQKYETQLDTIITNSVHMAEQKGEAAVQKGLPKPAPGSKLDMAVNFALDEIKSHGLDELAKDKLVDLIEAKLGQIKFLKATTPAAPAPAPAAAPAK